MLSLLILIRLERFGAPIKYLEGTGKPVYFGESATGVMTFHNTCLRHLVFYETETGSVNVSALKAGLALNGVPLIPEESCQIEWGTRVSGKDYEITIVPFSSLERRKIHSYLAQLNH